MLHCGDNLEIMRSMDDGCIDLIATDPPFNTGKDWGAFNDKWEGGMKGYLKFMEPRLVEMHRLLKDTGSIYLHCDTNASHYLKVMMDGIFGMKHFRNEIVWKRHHAHNDAHNYGRIHDIILFYVCSNEHVFHKQYIPYSDDYVQSQYRHRDQNGRRFMTAPLTADALSGHSEYEWGGITRRWICSRTTLDAYAEGNKLYFSKSGLPRLKVYLDTALGIGLQDIWTDIVTAALQPKEATGYKTQKPLKLLERIIMASSNQGDVVLDPFCGSGTALRAAKTLGRKYIGIDQNPEAIRITENRLNPPQQELFTA